MEISIIQWISIFGIIFVMIGTLLSLWTVLLTKTNYVGTAAHHDDQQINFRKDKIKVIIGFSLIFIVSVLQIIGVMG